MNNTSAGITIMPPPIPINPLSIPATIPIINSINNVLICFIYLIIFTKGGKLLNNQERQVPDHENFYEELSIY